MSWMQGNFADVDSAHPRQPPSSEPPHRPSVRELDEILEQRGLAADAVAPARGLRNCEIISHVCRWVGFIDGGYRIDCEYAFHLESSLRLVDPRSSAVKRRRDDFNEFHESRWPARGPADALAAIVPRTAFVR